MKKNPAFVSPSSPALAGDVWFLHGWGESPAPFRGVLASPLAERFRLFAPGLPGFGGRAPIASAMCLEGIAAWLVGEIRATSGSGPVALVGHSIGGMIATRAAEALGEQVRGVVSIEGNLTRSDAFFTGQALLHDSGEELRQDGILRLAPFVQEGEVPPAYLESFKRSDPETLLEVGKSAARESHGRRAGSRYRRLRCPKVYYWGTESTHAKTRAFLARHGLEHRCFEGCGHWLMLDQEADFLAALAQDLRRFFGGG